MLTEISRAVLESHVAWLGKTGAGKSGGIRAAVIEPLLAAGERVCCIDPTDTQWGIRLNPDGTPSRYKPIIFGGRHGDRPIGANDGEAIAEAVGTSNSSVIISTKLMRPADRTEFFTAFAETLLRVNVGKLYLIIDEAHLFAPQAGGMGLGRAASDMLHATNDLVSLGRGAGLSIILATQRSAKIHKDSVSQCETLIAMRMSHPLDQAAVEDWIGIKRLRKMKKLPAKYMEHAEEVLGGIGFLPDRRAYIWAPDPKIDVFGTIDFPTYKTFDSGERNVRGAAMKLQPIDLTALEGKLKQIAEKKEADDPEKLRGRIARLEADLATAQAVPAADPDAYGALERHGHAQHEQGIAIGQRDGFAKGWRMAWPMGAKAGRHHALVAAAGLVDALGDTLTDMSGKVDIQATPATPPPPDDAPGIPPASAITLDGRPLLTPSGAPLRAGDLQPGDTVHYERGANGVGKVTSITRASPSTGDARQSVLNAMAELRALSVQEPTREIVAMMAGYENIRSKGIHSAFMELMSEGLIESPSGGRLALTPAGTRLSKPAKVPLSGTEMRERVCTMIGAPADRLMRTLIKAYPASMPRERLAAETGYENVRSKGFHDSLMKLRSLGFAELPSGAVKATSVLFP